MLIARLQSPAFQPERMALAKYLTFGKARFASRVLHAARHGGPLPGNAHRLLSEFCDLAFEAIRTDFYRPLHIWCRMHADESDADAGALAFVRQACTTLDAECEAALPGFAPLLGDVRFALRRITLAIAARGQAASNAFEHDAVDIALDNAMMSLDARDADLGEQARIRGDWAGRIAEALTGDADFRLHVQRGAMLADIGKITTPRHILSASRRSIAENIVFEQHAHAGWEIVSHIPELAEFAPIVLHHHEYADGTGYPDGLLARDTPLGARITVVADELTSALAAIRPNSVSLHTVFTQLTDNVAARYDAPVLCALTEILARFDESE